MLGPHPTRGCLCVYHTLSSSCRREVRPQHLYSHALRAVCNDWKTSSGPLPVGLFCCCRFFFGLISLSCGCMDFEVDVAVSGSHLLVTCHCVDRFFVTFISTSVWSSSSATLVLPLLFALYVFFGPHYDAREFGHYLPVCGTFHRCPYHFRSVNNSVQFKVASQCFSWLPSCYAVQPRMCQSVVLFQTVLTYSCRDTSYAP